MAKSTSIDIEIKMPTRSMIFPSAHTMELVFPGKGNNQPDCLKLKSTLHINPSIGVYRFAYTEFRGELELWNREFRKPEQLTHGRFNDQARGIFDLAEYCPYARGLCCWSAFLYDPKAGCTQVEFIPMAGVCMWHPDSGNRVWYNISPEQPCIIEQL